MKTIVQWDLDEPLLKRIKFENSDILNYKYKTFGVVGVGAKHSHVCVLNFYEQLYWFIKYKNIKIHLP